MISSLQHSQHAHNVETIPIQCWFTVRTLNQRWNNVNSTLIQSQDVEPTFDWRCFNAVCPMGCLLQSVPWQNIPYMITGASVEDSDQPAHPRSLIKVFATHSSLQRLIRLSGCTCWSESSLGAHAIFYEMLCTGSYFKQEGQDCPASLAWLPDKCPLGWGHFFYPRVVIWTSHLDTCTSNEVCQLAFRLRRRGLKRFFQNGNRGGHLWFSIVTILNIFDLQVAPIVPIKFRVNLPYSSGAEVQNRFSKISAVVAILNFRS